MPGFKTNAVTREQLIQIMRDEIASMTGYLDRSDWVWLELTAKGLAGTARQMALVEWEKKGKGE